MINMEIIAWHMLTGDTNASDDDLKQHYVDVLESGVLLPPSHRGKETIYLKNPSIYSVDALAGDDDYVFLGLLPYQTKNYFLAQSDKCYFGPESQDWGDQQPYLHQSIQWVYGNCELRNASLLPSGGYGFGFSATKLIEQGAYFGTEDLIDFYQKIIKDEKYRVQDFTFRDPLAAKYFNFLHELSQDKAEFYRTSDPDLFKHIELLKKVLIKIQERYRLKGVAALDQLETTVEYCYNKFNKYSERFGDGFHINCGRYEKAEILFPGPLFLSEALYFIEDGVVYNKEGQKISLKTPTFKRTLHQAVTF